VDEVFRCNPVSLCLCDHLWRWLSCLGCDGSNLVAEFRSFHAKLARLLDHLRVSLTSGIELTANGLRLAFQETRTVCGGGLVLEIIDPSHCALHLAWISLTRRTLLSDIRHDALSNVHLPTPASLVELDVSLTGVSF